MIAERRARHALLALCLALAAAGVAAQTQTKPFEPSVGQQGKDVVWVPTSQALVEKMLELAKLTPQDYLIDLGSGDGRTVITAAKRGATALGIEFNPDMVELSTANAKTEGVTAKASFRQGDLFEADLSKANVITLFLLPDINMRLRPTLLDLKPGTRIVSNTFDMQDWEADQTETVTDGCSSWCTALLWIVPAKVDGSWQTPRGTLTLKQEFQMLSGMLDATPISNGRMRGGEITFTAGGTTYAGQVNGAVIKGTMSGGSSGSWTASRR